MSDDFENDFMDDDHNRMDSSSHDSDALSFHGQGGFYELDKKKYAWGLIWDLPNLELENDKLSKRKIAKQAKEAAPSMGANLYLVTEHQYALGSTSHEQASGMRSVATSLMDRWGDSFVAAFELENFYYLIAVKDGIVIPGSDVRTNSVDEAMNFVNSKLTSDESDEWGRIVAPATWDIPKSTEEKFDLVIRASRSRIRLKDATTKSLLKKAVILSSAAIICYGGYYAYNLYEAHKIEAEQALQKLNASKAMQAAKMRAQNAAKNELWPWDNQPIGQYAIATCQSAMSNIPVILPGYAFTGLSCSPSSGTVTAYFIANGGSYVTVVDSVNKLTNMHPHISHHENNIDVVYDFTSAFQDKMFTKHNEYGDVNKEWKWLDEEIDFHNLRNLIKISLTTPPKTNPNAKKTKESNIDHMVFKSLGINIVSSYDPMDWMNYLSPLKAFVVKEIGYNVGNSKNKKQIGWTIEGVAYEGIMQSEIDNPGKSRTKAPATVPVGSSKDSGHQTQVKSKQNNSLNNQPSVLVGASGLQYQSLGPEDAPNRSDIKVAPVPYLPGQQAPIRSK